MMRGQLVMRDGSLMTPERPRPSSRAAHDASHAT